MMQSHLGLEMIYQCAQPTPTMLASGIHPSRAADPVRPDPLPAGPAIRALPLTHRFDPFGKRCSRLVAPQGRFVPGSDAAVNDPAAPDSMAPSAVQTPVQDLPASTLICLAGSRGCEAQRRPDIVWQPLASVPAGRLERFRVWIDVVEAA